MDDLISRSALGVGKCNPEVFENKAYADGWNSAIAVIESAPAVDAVSRPVVEQIQWERDCAIEQLKEHNIPFGGIAPDVVKVVRCKDCEYRFVINGHNKNGCPISDRRIWMKDDDFCSHGKRKLTDEEWNEICHHERREENATD